MVTFLPGAGRICPGRGEVFLKEGGFAARTSSLFEGAVCAADWGSLQLQILAGGGEGRDHLCQLLHHTLVVVLCRSGKLLQSLVDELGTEGFLRLEEEVILGIACEGTVLATGGSVALEDRAIAQKKSAAVMENAADQGAEMMITACPLCEYNLKKNTPADGRLPVYYFTELLAEALGVKE